MRAPTLLSPDLEKLRRELAIGDLDKVYNIVLDLLKWCVATALALNGAALIAIIGASDLRPLLANVPGFLFGIGVILALFSGILMAIDLARLGAELMEMLWRGDTLDVPTFEDFTPHASNGKLNIFALCLLFISIICFVCGCVRTGFSVIEIERTKAQSSAVAKK